MIALPWELVAFLVLLAGVGCLALGTVIRMFLNDRRAERKRELESLIRRIAQAEASNAAYSVLRSYLQGRDQSDEA